MPLPRAEITDLQVPGAYTQDAWQQSILPLIERLGTVIPDADSLLGHLRNAYRRDYFVYWQRLLAAFPGVLEVPRAERRALAALLLDESPPFQRLLDVAYEHLNALSQTAATSPGGRTPDLPLWAQLMMQYNDSESRRTSELCSSSGAVGCQHAARIPVLSSPRQDFRRAGQYQKQPIPC